MGEILIKNAVVREKGFLYFVDSQGNVCRVEMNRTGRKPSKKK